MKLVFLVFLFLRTVDFFGVHVFREHVSRKWDSPFDGVVREERQGVEVFQGEGFVVQPLELVSVLNLLR